MAAKNEDQRRKEEVMAAIASLRELVPAPRYGECRNIKNKVIAELSAQLKTREKELAKDAKIVKLQKAIADEKCRVSAEIKGRKAKIDDLLRRLRLRGVTDQLLKDIEAVAALPAIKLWDDNCDNDD